MLNEHIIFVNVYKLCFEIDLLRILTVSGVRIFIVEFSRIMVSNCHMVDQLWASE